MGGPGSGMRPTIGIKDMTPEQRADYGRVQRQKYREHFERTGRPYTDPGAFKRCFDCKQSLLVSLFRQHPSGQYFKRCKKCDAAFDRRSKIKKEFGISDQQYEALFQNAYCNICGDKRREKLVVDHCHESGKLRAILCSNCNTLLGFAEDNPAILERAINYLRRHGK